MVCFNAELKIIYIHIPKCAGTTIEKILTSSYGFQYFNFPDDEEGDFKSTNRYKFLSDPRGKLGIYKYILNYSLESKFYDLESFFKFTFVRHPSDKALSALNYLNDQKEDFDLNDFLRNSFVNNYNYMHLYLSQLNCIKNLENEINMNFIGRVENLIHDLKYLFNTILNLENKGFENIFLNRSNDEIILSNEELNNINGLIYDIHREDFQIFGYSPFEKFGGNLQEELI